MKESNFQKSLKDDLIKRFPGCIVKKTDPRGFQGFPDLLILFGKMWALLEVKASKDSIKQPNQEFHVERLNNMGFSRFIYPENKEEVLNDLSKHFLES